MKRHGGKPFSQHSTGFGASALNPQNFQSLEVSFKKFAPVLVTSVRAGTVRTDVLRECAKQAQLLPKALCGSSRSSYFYLAEVQRRKTVNEPRAASRGSGDQSST
jgi:hypothetical protein